MPTKLSVKFTNTAVAQANYQMCDVDVQHAWIGSESLIVAQVLAYFAAVSGNMAAGTKITECLVREIGSAGAYPFPFPVADYTAVKDAALTDGITVPGMAAYGTTIGSGALCPLGTSISVSELTAFPGRSGRGRHFLPFASAGVVSAGGELGTGQPPIIIDCYNELIRGFEPGGGLATSPILTLNPAVTNGVTSHTITHVKPQPVFSNLESRRR